jgi:hypothetical protein
VAIDGSKFKAVNNRDKNFTDRKLQARIEQLEDSIKRYLIELDRADRDATAVLPSRVAHLKAKIARVKEQMQTLDEIGERMKASADGQISLTDPDARSMATSGRGTGIVGYNVQTAVDAKHHMIEFIIVLAVNKSVLRTSSAYPAGISDCIPPNAPMLHPRGAAAAKIP